MAEQEGFEGLVVPTTHWDRDWYWSFERFRVKLLELFAGLKELWQADPDYVFTCDGQTIMVEDFLDALPEERDLLVAMGAAGRLRMGPLYVLSDVYCTGGEALIRNMLLGAAQADAFHARQKVFYLPDTFGLTPEVPMLAAGFGYDCVVFMRGLPAACDQERRFWHWQAADGSSCMVYRLRDGYANAAGLGRTFGTGEIMDSKSSGIHPGFSMNDALTKLQASVDRLHDDQGAPHLLLAGVDHQIPQSELPAILAKASTAEQGFRYGGLDELADGMRRRSDRDSWPLITGECHGDPGGDILGGTVSSRVYLKQANAAAEELLARVAEPVTAVLHHLGNREGLDGICREAWRQLLRAHPHDDITGCSCDLVHRENEAAITRASQAAEALRRRGAYLAVQHFGGQRPGDGRPGFICFDAGGNGIDGRIAVSVDFEGRASWADCPPPEHYRIVDQTGAAVPFRELGRHRGSEHPHLVLELELATALPPGAMRRFFIEELALPPASTVERVLENERLQATIKDDGSVDLLDKRSGRLHAGIGHFSDQADGGDEYNFSPIPGDVETLLTGLSWQRDGSYGCQGLQAIALQGRLQLPASGSMAGRSHDTVEVPVTIRYSLAPDDEALQVDIRIDNRAADHRLRWNCNLPGLPATSRAGLKYHSVERPVIEPWADDRGLLHLPIHPADHYIAAEGLAVFCPCPLNYEVVTGPQPRLAITLLRAVAMLSNGHMTRGPGAGPDIRTPEAQCQRVIEHRFAIRPYSVDEEDSLFEQAWRWRQQPVAGVLWAADPDWSGDEHDCLLAIDPGPVVISACKRSQDRRHGILRLFNTGRSAATAILRGALLQRLLPARLDEQPNGEDEITRTGEVYEVTVPAQGLATFIID